MAAWTSQELSKLAAAEELELASVRRDGRLRRPVTIWVVRHGDDLYVRSGYGRASGWFRGTEEWHEGEVRAGGVEKDVSFVEPEDTVQDQIDAAYRQKYGHYEAQYVDGVTSPQARAATIKLAPR